MRDDPKVELALRQKQRIRRRRFGAQVVSTIIQPPFDTAHNIWSFDPDGVGAAQYVTGPTGTVTTPAKTQGTPSYYTFGSTDKIDFGNALESTFVGVAPTFTLYACISPSAGDLSAAVAAILSKDDAASQREFNSYLALGVPNVAVFQTLNGATLASRAASAAVTAARHVFAFSFNGGAAVGSRITIYVDGSPVSMGAETGNGSGPVSTGTASLTIGHLAGGAAPPLSAISYSYGYNVAHSAGTVASISSWLQTTKGWV